MQRRWLSSVSLFALIFGSSLTPVGLAGFAHAADLAYEPAEVAPIAAPVFSWAGFYAGVHGGYASGDHDETGVPGASEPEPEPTEPTLPTKPTLPTSTTRLLPDARLDDPDLFLTMPGDATAGFNVDGGLVGLHAGYNFQVDRFVIGFEADLDYTGVKGDEVTEVLGFETANSFKTDWQGTIRGRAGFAVDRLLVYGTGGVAFARGELSIANAGLGLNQSDSNVHTGWTAGGGIEYAFTGNWLGRIEGRYTDFGSKTYDFGDAGQIDADWNQTSILFGLSYKL